VGSTSGGPASGTGAGNLSLPPLENHNPAKLVQAGGICSEGYVLRSMWLRNRSRGARGWNGDTRMLRTTSRRITKSAGDKSSRNQPSENRRQSPPMSWSVNSVAHATCRSQRLARADERLCATGSAPHSGSGAGAPCRSARSPKRTAATEIQVSQPTYSGSAIRCTLSPECLSM
jgi:hypothetical protein